MQISIEFIFQLFLCYLKLIFNSNIIVEFITILFIRNLLYYYLLGIIIIIY